MGNEDIRERYPTVFHTKRDEKEVKRLNTGLVIFLKNKLLENVMEDIVEICEQIDPFKLILQAKNDEIDSLNKTIRGKVKTIGKKNSEIEKRKDKIVELQSDIWDLASQISNLKKWLKDERGKKFKEAKNQWKKYFEASKQYRRVKKDLEKNKYKLDLITEGIKERVNYVKRIEQELDEYRKRLKRASIEQASLLKKISELESRPIELVGVNPKTFKKMKNKIAKERDEMARELTENRKELGNKISEIQKLKANNETLERHLRNAKCRKCESNDIEYTGGYRPKIFKVFGEVMDDLDGGKVEDPTVDLNKVMKKKRVKR